VSERELVIRAPNHLGDLVMALPALALAGPADIVLARGLAPLAALARFEGRLIELERGAAGFLDAARQVRRGRYERGVLLTPSFSSALMFKLGRVRRRRGLNTDRRGALLTDRIARAEAESHHRAVLYAMLVTGVTPSSPPVPQLAVPAEVRERWRRLAGPRTRWTAGLFPGSNAPSRRWDPYRFAELARRLTARGARVIVFGSRREADVTRVVAGDVAFDAGGRTDLPLLAAGLAECDILVTNDSGPLHLAAAVGTATVSLWGAGDPAISGVAGAKHRMLRRADLPCVPCVKNECPRSGAGYLLPKAERECLQLIEVPEVLAATGRPPSMS
jgi:heptosyltransferase-2